MKTICVYLARILIAKHAHKIIKYVKCVIMDFIMIYLRNVLAQRIVILDQVLLALNV